MDSYRNRASSEEKIPSSKLEMSMFAKMGNLMGSIERIEDYIPVIKTLPDKVGSVELGLDSLKQRMI